MQVQVLTGQQNNPDSSVIVQRGGKQGDGIVSELHGKYYEQAYRGNLFILDSGAITLASTYTTASAAGTAKLICGIFNPTGSGKNVVVLGAMTCLISGTSTGEFVYNAQTFPAGVSVTVTASGGTIRSSVINTIAVGSASVCTPQNAVVITRSDAATTALTQIGTCGGTAAIAAGAGIYSVYDDVAGKIIIPPGTVFGISQIGAGTGAAYGTLYWEEVPV